MDVSNHFKWINLTLQPLSINWLRMLWLWQSGWITYEILDDKKSSPGLLHIHPHVIRDDVVWSCLQLVVPHVLLGLLNGCHIRWVFIIIVRFAGKQLIPLKKNITKIRQTANVVSLLGHQDIRTDYGQLLWRRCNTMLNRLSTVTHNICMHVWTAYGTSLMMHKICRRPIRYI